MKICNIEKEQFDEFAKRHKYRNFYQSSTYTRIMPKFNYTVSYIGITNDDSDKLIGAAALILQDAFMKNKVAYAPRGILFDFTDAQKVEELVDALKMDLGKNGIISLKMDPAIPKSIRDSKGNIINTNNEAEIISENLIDNGFIYTGETLNFEGEKPRWETLTVLQNNLEEIYKSFDKRCRNKINKAIRSGVEVYRDKNKDLSQLKLLLKNKNTTPFKYYEEICASFGNNADLYYAKLNTEQFVISSKKIYEDEIEKNNNLANEFQTLAQQESDRRDVFDKKILSDKLLNIYKNNMIFATNMLKEYPEGLIIGGAINVIYDNASFSIIDGYNEKFKNLNPNYLLRWQMISDYHKEKMKYFNMGGISGEFKNKTKYSTLNESKLGFYSTITEYIGEYEIVLNNLKYGIYKNIKK